MRRLRAVRPHRRAPGSRLPRPSIRGSEETGRPEERRSLGKRMSPGKASSGRPGLQEHTITATAPAPEGMASGSGSSRKTGRPASIAPSAAARPTPQSGSAPPPSVAGGPTRTGPGGMRDAASRHTSTRDGPGRGDGCSLGKTKRRSSGSNRRPAVSNPQGARRPAIRRPARRASPTRTAGTAAPS